MDPRRSPSSSTSHPEQASGPRHELGAQYASLETPSATRVIGGKFDQRDGQRPECAVVPGMTDVLAACERANGIVTPLGAPARLFVRRSEKRIGPPLCPSLRRLAPKLEGFCVLEGICDGSHSFATGPQSEVSLALSAATWVGLMPIESPVPCSLNQASRAWPDRA